MKVNMGSASEANIIHTRFTTEIGTQTIILIIIPKIKVAGLWEWNEMEWENMLIYSKKGHCILWKIF